MKQYPLAQPFITEDDIRSVTDVLNGSTLSRGPMIKEFESMFCVLTQCKYASAVSSGTAGLILGLQALGIKSGDEVITVSFTVPATVNSICALGAKPVMIDIDSQTLGMCPIQLKNNINTKTKAIIVVHAFGKSAHINSIIEIAKNHNIPVIEDACEAIGNSYQDKPLGSMADIGVFGFYPNKQITTGEGGMVVCNDKKLKEKIDLLKNHGRTMSGEWLDQLEWGWNFRLSELNAALGVSQLQKLEQIKSKRKEIASWYQQFLKPIKNIETLSFSSNEADSSWFVYVILVPKDQRDELFNKLNKKGIQCGKYFAAVHWQPYFKKLQNIKLPITERISSRALALPFYHRLQKTDVEYICQQISDSL